MKEFILAIDQGTTSTRAIIFDQKAKPIGQHQIEFKQYFPDQGWVEHDPEEIWQKTLECCHQAVATAKLQFQDIKAIGITNQRETVVVWDWRTSRPIYHAIVWQDRRTAEACSLLKQQGYEAQVQQQTGLLLDPYFSATKIAWMLERVPEARKRAEKGDLACGTIDSFLLWRLTKSSVHATDITNASRTLLFDIHKQAWDKDLLKLFNIPATLLPEVFDNCYEFGVTHRDLFGVEIPILAMAGDQQAALVGQACFHPGMVKSTYGTGAFLMLNTGTEALLSKNRLLTTIGYRVHGQIAYAIEGSIFSAGSIVHWLRDQIHLIKEAKETTALVNSVRDNGGVYFVPAFTGLGAPYWNPNVRGVIEGLTRDTQLAHIVRAGLEAVAYQTRDLIESMMADGADVIKELRVDGGMAVNDWLMQFLADILHITVVRPSMTETTALGVAYLAGLQAGWFKSLDQIGDLWRCQRNFQPQLPEVTSAKFYQGWKQAIARIL